MLIKTVEKKFSEVEQFKKRVETHCPICDNPHPFPLKEYRYCEKCGLDLYNVTMNIYRNINDLDITFEFVLGDMVK